VPITVQSTLSATSLKKEVPSPVSRPLKISRTKSGGNGHFIVREGKQDATCASFVKLLKRNYLSKKSFMAGTFSKLNQVLLQGAELHTEHLIAKDNQAVVELHSLATAKNGMRFDNRYCRVVEFQDGLMVRVRAYLDSAMVTRLFQENPIQDLVRAS
jgi:hypothetical protein